MSFINTSVFSIYKIGPGPSSSHTIGPMTAGGCFRAELERFAGGGERRIMVYLYGSLSATGRGHGSGAAVVAGLLGESAESCAPETLKDIAAEPERVYNIEITGTIFRCSLADVVFAGEMPGAAHPNALDFVLLGSEGELFRQRYYSIGGGEIRLEGGAVRSAPEVRYKFANIRQFRQVLAREGVSAVEVLLANEMAIGGCGESEVWQRLAQVRERMRDSVRRGLAAGGVLPGKIGLERKARDIMESAASSEFEYERLGLMLNAFSLAAAEENAAGNRVVTAPTSGSSGVLPGVISWLEDCRKLPQERVLEGLLVGGLFGLVSRHNGSISGAEVGCQGEIGVASAMGAALMAQARGEAFGRVENAAEIALEHHLGMTCDPVGGYVQIPCIERNAVAAATAVNAYLLSGGNPNKHKLDFDAVVEAMLETGRDMNSLYKETSGGGLAVCPLRCR